MKCAKSEVDYSPGKGGERCGNCKYYRARTCSLVVGSISPNYWCELFKRRG
jgi:hypothetical protein